MNLFALTSLLCGLSSLALAVFALVVGKTKSQRLFVAFNVAVAVWGLGCFIAGIADNRDLALFGWKMGILGGTFISSIFYHLVSVLCNSVKKKIIYFSHAQAALFSFLTFAFPDYVMNETRITFGLIYLKAGFVLMAAVLIYLLFVVLSYTTLFKYMKIAQGRDKQQAAYIIFGFFLGFLGGTSILLPEFGIDIIYPIGNLGICIYVLIAAYAIFKHQLLDIRVVIKKTLFYSLFVFLISIGYVSAIFMAHKLFLGEIPRSFVFQKLLPLYSIPSLIGAVLFAILGLFVIFNKPRTNEKVIFSVLCFATFFWELVWFDSFFISDDRFLTYLAKIVYFTITPLPFVFYHFIVSYLKKKNEFKYVIIFYVFSFALIILAFPTNLFIAGNQRHSWGNFSKPGPLYILFTIGALASMLRGLVILRGALRNAKDDPKAQNQIRYLLLGLGLFFFCTLDFLQVYGAPWFPVGTFFFILSFLVIAYAISKHQLLDVRVVIKRTLFYSAMTVVVSLIYLSLVFLFHTLFLKGDKGGASFLINFTGILFIAITFKPLEIAIHRFMERRFFKGTIIEIAAQKQLLETELERRERLKSVGILAAGMAHEIKNPLTVINTFADYLPAKYDDPEFREKFSRIVKQEVARVKEIVSNLLLFSKPSEPIKRECDLSKILIDITELLSNEMLKSNIKLNLDGSNCLAFVDPDQMKQAFLNIIMNAIDAMPNGGVLTVSTSTVNHGRHSDALLITISDTGCGIPQDKIPHIFDPFYTDKEQGTGLGLAVTHSIIEKNGGTIEVESEMGKGTMFKIILPIHR